MKFFNLVFIKGIKQIASLVITCLFCISATAQTSSDSDKPKLDHCKGAPLVVQVLGSGGPLAYDGRASTGYIIWINGQSRIMIDVGGGTFLRFGEAGARTEDIDVIAISHLHPDHVADLPAILWSAAISRRNRPLTIIGPSGNYLFPDISSYLLSLFGRSDSPFQQISSLGLQTQAIKVNADIADVPTVHKVGDLEVLTLGVPHDSAPTLAFRVNTRGKSIAFAGDQTGNNPAFASLVRGVDLLVMHLAVSEQGGKGFLSRWHAPPSKIGEIAAAAKPRTLVLSHFIGSEPNDLRAEYYSLFDLESNVDIVRKYYSGRLIVAEDLLCIPLK